MLFSSIDFALFLPIVFGIYWLLNRNLKVQNLFVLIASYFFYGWWDWRFLILIFISTSVDYLFANKIHATQKQSKKKRWLFLSLGLNLSLLGFFKYYNFFLDSLVSSYSFFGKEINPERLDIILPVGISFYTFQSLSYIIDVYRKNLEPSKDVVSFFAFVSFFPQLVAGPIERAANLLPQFYKKREFDYVQSVVGMRQILWGLFKKMVIADNCAVIVDKVFEFYPHYPGSTLAVALVFFSFQIYGDFSGYSDIAIGTARLFGFELKRNFHFPYFSKNIAEFWQRWHISLSTWFRDYIYYPLGGSKVSKLKHIRNVSIVFLISGFWHGANWTFVAWGAFNALLLILFVLLKDKKIISLSFIPSAFKKIVGIVFTFLLITFSWVFFRSKSITESLEYIKIVFSKSIISHPIIEFKFLIILLVFFVIVEWKGKQQEFAIEQLNSLKSQYARWIFYSFIVFLVGAFMVSKHSPFIYFQF